MSSGLLFFVHGLGGNPKGTWGNFPDLIAADSTLKRYDVDSFRFPTSLFRWWPWSTNYPKIQTLADALRTYLDNHFPNRDDITLVCHSLGGLIARKYLVEEVKRKRPLRVRGLLLYAVPNNGAQLALVASEISWRHNQLRQLRHDADVVRDLNEDWVTLKLRDTLRVRYVVAALDRVVDEHSAREFWGNPDVDVLQDRGHRDVVKPINREDTVFLILKNFVHSFATEPSVPPVKMLDGYATGAPRRAAPRANARFRVIGFDLDGTLLRGFQYSWTLVWNHLKVPDVVWKESWGAYLRGDMTFKDYHEWVDHDYQHMRARGLKRQDFAEITKVARPTKNLRETLQLLRNEGFILAIISGGIDVFLTEAVPDAMNLFDYVCINRFRFDDQGIISGIDPTPFDFGGKAVALEEICKRHGATLEQSVFVGEAFNDTFAAKAAGLSIAYPPDEEVMQTVARIPIVEDALMQILKHVLER